jgi:hypothetical protein
MDYTFTTYANTDRGRILVRVKGHFDHLNAFHLDEILDRVTEEPIEVCLSDTEKELLREQGEGNYSEAVVQAEEAAGERAFEMAREDGR